jgi:hypothetical protein
MNSHDLTAAGFALFALLGVLLQGLSLRRKSQIPPLGAAFGRLMRTRSGRVGVLAAWAWLGLHFFAR